MEWMINAIIFVDFRAIVISVNGICRRPLTISSHPVLTVRPQICLPHICRFSLSQIFLSSGRSVPALLRAEWCLQ
jgi:hypothetical protein